MAEVKIDPKLKGCLEIHMRTEKGGTMVFWLKDGKAYYADGRQVEKDKLFICPYCKSSPPAMTLKEIDLAKHIVSEHPDKAKGKETKKKG